MTVSLNLVSPMTHENPCLNVRTCISGLATNTGAELVRYGRSKPGILSLGQGEGDAPTPSFIADAARAAMDAGKTFYGPVLGLDALRAELSDYYKRTLGVDLPQNRLFITSSGTTAMHIALTALLNPGDEVVAITPIWRNLLSAIEMTQANIREVALRNDNGRWHLDMAEFFAAVGDKTRVLLINSPSNPTGWMATADEIKAILEFARARGIWVISDEVYGRITYDGKVAPSFLHVAEDGDKLFVVNSFSKSWAMTGWRLGWLVGPSAAEAAVRDIALYNNMGPPTFTQYGAIEALRQGEDFIAQQLDLWRGNRAFLEEWFGTQKKINAHAPEAAFYSFFRVDGEDDCLKFARRLVDEANLLLAPGCSFGKSGRKYMRMCFAVSRPRLEEALSRLEKAIK